MIVCYFLISFFFSCVPHSGATDIQRARIFWSSASTYLKTTVPGEIRDVSFVFTNHSLSPVSVRNATADCGCVSVRRPYGAILPDATGVILVRVRASAAEGSFTKHVYISFDNGDYSKLLITGETHSLFKVEPRTIRVKDALLNVSKTVLFDIFIDKAVKTEFRNARLENSDIELVHIRTARTSTGVRCSLTLVPRVPKRRIISSLILRTSCKRQPELRIPLIVYPKMPFDIRPPTAFFGVVKPGVKTSKKFVLKSKDSSAIRIKKIKDGDRDATFSIEEAAAGQVTLNVEILCADKPGFATGELVIELDDPAMPKVSIPYSYVVRE